MWRTGIMCLATAAICLSAPALAEVATMRVDLRDAPRGLFHADLTFPAQAGPMTFVYPRWIPGDHLPAGPIEDLAGLTFTADGKPLTWRRDPLAVDAFHLVVPGGTHEIEAHLDFLAVPSQVTAINHAENATSENLAILRWHVVTLYPLGEAPATYAVHPSVILPGGWSFASAMTGTAMPDGSIDFPVLPLERLIDSPLIAGRFLQSYRLTPHTTIRHSIDIVADDPADLAMTQEQQRHLSDTLDQALALFGSKPFAHYDFLVTLSGKIRPRVSIGGQEHHESSDDVGGPGLFRDPVARETLGETLAHEYAHAWNGKYRRPIGEATRDYQQPDDNSLLWVYEGLTSYLGRVLAVRGGAWTPQEFRDSWANTAADMATRQGRQWRSLADTAVGLEALMRSRPAWGDWRRSADYYPEGALLWLDIDLEIRRLSRGKRSLDDFCRLFFAKDPARDPLVKPYDLDELVAALGMIAPTDWKTFLSARLDAVGTNLPTDAMVRAGWSLTYTAEANPFAKANETGGAVNAFYSIGLSVGGDGEIGDVRHNSEAFAAGLAPGMRIVSVDGAKYGGARLRQAVDAKATINLIVANGDAIRPVLLDYRDGQKYPMLVRRADAPDLLDAIAKPLPIGASR